MYKRQDPYDLYSWDPGTNSYIPFQAAESDCSPVGRGNGWYYYDDWSEGDSRTFCVDCDDTMASVRVWSAVEVIGRKAFRCV